MDLAHDVHGAGPALVLLHPLGADRRVWDPVVAQLSRHRQVVAVDLPGFGESPRLERTPTPQALGDAVASFVRRLGLIRPHVAGNSLGGWVALELALAGEARAVTAIAPAGLWAEALSPKRGTARKLAGAALPFVDRITTTSLGRRLLLAGIVARPEQVPASVAAHLVRAYATAPGFLATNDAMRARCFRGLERIRVPVTLVWPEHDRLVARPSRLPTAVANRTITGAGHIPMWDAPDEVARVLLDASA